MVDERDERWQMTYRKDGRQSKGIWKKEGHKELGIMKRRQMNGMKDGG